MKIYKEQSLNDFHFWSGGADRAQNLTEEDFDVVEGNLEELYPEGMSDTELNDFFWFEFDTIAEWLGYKDEEDFDLRRDPSYIDDDELEDYIVDYWRDYLDDVYQEKGEKELKRIIEDLFGEDADEVFENHKDDAVTKTPAGVYYHFLNDNYDGAELTEILLDDDQGWNLLDDFPTKEEFREIMMGKRKTINNN